MSSVQISPRSPAIGFALLLTTTAILSACSEATPPAVVEQDITNVTSVEPEISIEGESRTGLYSYYADAALFTDCVSGKKLPLHLNATSLELERAYGQAGLNSAQPMLVEIIGQVEVRPGMEKGTQLPHMVASQLIRVSDEQECPQTEVSVFNTHWQLIEVAGMTPASGPDGRLPHLVFEEQGEFYGYTGCNNLRGGYELDGKKLTLSRVAVTKMACPDPDNQEGAFLQALNTVTTLQHQDQHLLLSDENGATLMQFEVAPM